MTSHPPLQRRAVEKTNAEPISQMLMLRDLVLLFVFIILKHQIAAARRQMPDTTFKTVVLFFVIIQSRHRRRRYLDRSLFSQLFHVNLVGHAIKVQRRIAFIRLRDLFDAFCYAVDGLVR